MKVTAVGVVRMSGKKEGRDYDFCNLRYLVPVDVVAKPTYNKVGYGFEVSDAEVSVDVLEKFKTLKWPCQLELQFDQITRFGRLQSVVTDFKQVA
jgi:hypothetical protein